MLKPGQLLKRFLILKRFFNSVGPKVTGTAALLAVVGISVPAEASVPLRRADIEQILNRVELLPRGRSARTARVADILAIGDALRTAAASRAELRFNDGSLARVGQRATFHFIPNTRNFRLSNGTMLLLIPPGRGRSTIQTPSAVTGIQGSALVVRHVESRNLTMVMALTNNPDGAMTVTLADCDGGDECTSEYGLNAGQMALIQGHQVDIVEFDLFDFYETSTLIDGLELTKPDSTLDLGPGVNEVRQEIDEALRQHQPLEEDQSTLLNPAMISVTSTPESVAGQTWLLEPVATPADPTAAMSPPAGLLAETSEDDENSSASSSGVSSSPVEGEGPDLSIDTPEDEAPATPPVEEPLTTPAEPATSPVVETPAEPATPPVVETPAEPATPPVVETPAEPATPPVVEAPASPEPPAVVETPAESATPPVVETPAEPATPPVVEAPASPEPPAVVETPAEPATPPVVETPAEPATPPVVEAPASPEPPAVVETPAEPATPPVVETPVEPVTPPVMETPASPEPPVVVDPPAEPATPPVVETPVAPEPPPVVEFPDVTPDPLEVESSAPGSSGPGQAEPPPFNGFPNLEDGPPNPSLEDGPGNADPPPFSGDD